MWCTTMPPSNTGNIIAYSLANYPSYYNNLTRIDNIPIIYDIKRIFIGLCINGNVTINKRNKVFTIIVVYILSAVMHTIEVIIAKIMH